MVTTVITAINTNKYHIEGYEIRFNWLPDYYTEVGADKINIGVKKVLLRSTLKLYDASKRMNFQCHVVHSTDDLKQSLQTIIDAAKAENKL